MAPQTYYYTKDQLEKILAEWNASEMPLPTASTKIAIAFPPGATWKIAWVSKSKMKSTYGKTLYQVDCR